MSSTVETTAAIWNTSLERPRHKLAMLALAEMITGQFGAPQRIGFLNDTAIKDLAQHADMSARKFNRTLIELEEAGVLETRADGLWFRL